MKYNDDLSPERLKFECLVHELSENHLEQAKHREGVSRLQEQEDAILDQLKGLGRGSTKACDEALRFFHILHRIKD